MAYKTPTDCLSMSGASGSLSLVEDAQRELDDALFDAFIHPAPLRQAAVLEALALGANPNAREEGRPDGATPIFRALSDNWFGGTLSDQTAAPLLAILLSAGADPNARGQGVFCEPHEEQGALRLAVELNFPEAVDVLLRHGADPLVEDSGDPAMAFVNVQDLSEQGAQSAIAIAKALMGRGGDIDGRGRCNMTLLAEAAHFGNVAMARGLLELGANPNHRGVGGATTLHLASSSGKERSPLGPAAARCAVLLMEAGADPQALDDAGATPASVAAMDVAPAIEAFAERLALQTRLARSNAPGSARRM